MTWRIATSFAVLVLCIASISWTAFRGPARVPVVPEAPSILDSRTFSELRANRVDFFNSDVQPSIVTAHELNREAASRCVNRISESFEGYRTGIAPFCKDVNSWGTRLGVITRMPNDWWYERTGVADYVENKFGVHLFTDKKLKEDIASALSQFREDISANQNALVIQIRAAIYTRDLPALPEIDYSQFASDLASQLTAYSAQAAHDSVVNLIVTEIASGVGGAVAEQLLVQLVSRLSAMAATSTATAGGATAGGAAAGGGSGALGGPVGIAAGLVIGIAVGGIIDWWMSGNFESQMAGQLNSMIDELSNEVLTGDASNPGLIDALDETCELLRKAYDESLRARIVGANS